jgi:hypothetical protein
VIYVFEVHQEEENLLSAPKRARGTDDDNRVPQPDNYRRLYHINWQIMPLSLTSISEMYTEREYLANF